MSPPDDLTSLLQRFTSRYRAALLTKAAVLAALGIGAIGVLAWRLHALRVAPLWRMGAPTALALVAASSLASWLRRRWISREGSAAHLDEAFGLQQRLVTAEQFAGAAQPPALYGLLVEDAARRVSLRETRFPKPLGRAAGALALVLLLLLLWPLAGRSPLLQLAQLPHATPPQPRPQPQVPPNPEQQDQSQHDGNSQQQRQPSSSGQESPSQSSGTGQPQQPGRGGDESQDASSQRDSGSQGGSQGEGQRQATSNKGEATSDKQQATSDKGQGTGDRKQETGDKGQGTSDKGQGTEQEDGDHSREPSSASGESDQRRDQSGSQASREQAGTGQGQSLGNQEALKAEIQKLLKDVSGELKELQAQMAAAQQQSASPPGASTDPDLYASPEAIDSRTGTALPIQLKTDTTPTASQRPGSGSGRPSGEVSGASPQTKAEDARLSDEPLQEPPASRQPVPPEYRSLFDRLSHPDAQPSQTSSP